MSTQNKRTNTKQRRQPLRCGRMVRPFDSRALDWLAKNGLCLTSTTEVWDEQPTIWWCITKGNMSISGHPLGSLRKAIKAAMKNYGQNPLEMWREPGAVPRRRNKIYAYH